MAVIRVAGFVVGEDGAVIGVVVFKVVFFGLLG